MAQIALSYSAAQVDAAIAKINSLVSVIEGNIVQLYNGSTAIYPLTKAEAVFFDGDTSKTLDEQFSQLEQEDLLLKISSKGLYLLPNATISNDIKNLLNFILNVKFSNPIDSEKNHQYILNVAGYHNNTIQFTITDLDTNSNYDFKINNIINIPTGIQSYSFSIAEDFKKFVAVPLYLDITVNWDYYINLYNKTLLGIFNETEYNYISNIKEIGFFVKDTNILKNQYIVSLNKCIKKVKLWGWNKNVLRYSFRLLGLLEDRVQVTIYDNFENKYIDFKWYISEQQIGVKEYTQKIDDIILNIVVNWDFFEGGDTGVVGDSKLDGTLFIPICFEYEKEINDIWYKHKINEKEENIGYFKHFNDDMPKSTCVVSPIKKIEYDSKISKVFVYTLSSGEGYILVGSIDQLNLFVARERKKISFSEGSNDIDVSSMDIYVRSGENIAFEYQNNSIKINYTISGSPNSEDAFMYTKDGYETTNPYQLQVYGAEKEFKCMFEVTFITSDTIKRFINDEKVNQDISNLIQTVSYLENNQGLITDEKGNKYKIAVVNGMVVAKALNFSNMLIIGNSYTTHPTTTDEESDYKNTFWWGHWSMAASAKSVAWTSLLEEVLQQRKPSAKITPVFGRRYETQLRTLDADDAFTYWDNGEWKGLKPNLSNFTNIDSILIFLGDNYNSNKWYELYKAMIEQFITWFPSATIILMSSVTRTNVNVDISQVASEMGLQYINMYGIKNTQTRSKLGNFVLGDNNDMYQINYGAVADHFGDYGEWVILNKVSEAIGYRNIISYYNININNLNFSIDVNYKLKGSIVSIFVNDTNVTTIAPQIITKSGQILETTFHETQYGNIFTFIMPPEDIDIN